MFVLKGKKEENFAALQNVLHYSSYLTESIQVSFILRNI